MQKFRKFRIAQYIICTFAFVVLLGSSVKANKQNPLKLLSIQNGDTVTLRWEANTPSSEIDSSPSLLDGQGSTIHDVAEFQAYLECISTNGDKKYAGSYGNSATEAELPVTLIDSGYVYKATVSPVHYHSYEDAEGVRIGAAARTGEEDKYVYFISKPNMELSASGNDITVEFDDAGDYVKYKIWYEQDGVSEVPFETIKTPISIITPRQGAGANTESSVKNGKAKLTYVIKGVSAGKNYRVRVEADNNSSYQLAPVFSDTKTIPTRPPFSVVEISENKIQLTWDGLGTQNISSIDLYQRANDDVNDRIIATIKPGNIEHYLINTPTTLTRYWIVVNYQYADYTTDSVTSEEVEYNPDIVNVTPGAIQNIQASYPRTYNGTPNMLELMWDMFKYTNSETGKTEIYAETLYDVLITDDIELVNDKSLSLESDIKFDQEIDDISSDSMSRFYKSYLTTVRDREGSIKSYSVADLKENQIYYARVLGKIVTNSQTLVSEPSTISFYITPTGALYMPAVLPKPPLQKREITSTSLSFEWNRAWYEVVHTDPTNTAEVHEWTSKIYSYDGHNFATLKEAETYAGPNNIERVTTTDVSTAAAANMWVSNHAGYVFRQVGFGDDQTHYEAVILQNNNATLAELERLVESYDKSTNGWQDITVYTDPTNNEILWAQYDGLKKNSSYMIIMRAYKYNELGDKVIAWKPTGIILSTTVDQEEIEPVPTVPVLFLHETEDISAKIKWKVNTSLNYEVRYSKVENVDNAESIIITNQMVRDLNAPIENGYYILEAVDLFPETGYFFWLKAKQTTGDKESTWSNPLSFVTSDLVPSPIVPPSGIGTAAISKPIGDGYVTVEWARTDEDIALDSYTGTKVSKNISYIFEIANNVKFLDAYRVECGGDSVPTLGDFDVMSKTMVQAKGLSGNTRYYIRLKTRIVCDGETADEHIEKESAWSIVKIFRTKSENEYDSEYESLAVPMADKTTKTYSGSTVRIDITNDERVINDFVKLEEFKYVFDFTNEKSQYKTKEAYIPISVLKAMQNRDISLVINTKGFSMQVNAKAFDNADYQRLTRAGGVNGLVVSVRDDNSIYPIKIDSKELSARFTTKYGDVATTYLEDYMDVSFDTTNATYYSKNEPVGMTYDQSSGSWKTAKDTYNLGNNLLFKTGKMGKVGASY